MSVRSSLPFQRYKRGMDQAVDSILYQMDMAISRNNKSPEKVDVDDGVQRSMLEECRMHPAKFRSQLLRDNGFETRRIGSSLDDWQLADFEATDQMWMRAAKVSKLEPRHSRAYLERPRGHSKTSDTALMVCWAVLAAPVMITGYAAAASEEQAKFIILSAKKLSNDNPWLGELLKIQEGKIVNIETGSSCEVVAAKANTKFGQTPDFVVCDELTHWTKKSVWSALFSGLVKVPTCTMVVITNAGHGKGSSWQWETRERLRKSDRWYFNSLDGIQASWMRQKDIEEQSEGLDSEEFKRLILNKWITGKAKGIPPNQIIDSVRLTGSCMNPNHNCSLVIGSLDIGISHDRTSLVWLGISYERRTIELLGHETWYPKSFQEGQVQLSVVEDAMIKGARQLGGVHAIYADNWQAVRSLQELQSIGIECQQVNYSGSVVVKRMAKDLVNAFRNGVLRLYYDSELERDLLSVEVAYHDHSKSYKLIAERDEHGHADSAFALAQGVMMGTLILEEALDVKDVSSQTELAFIEF